MMNRLFFFMLFFIFCSAFGSCTVSNDQKPKVFLKGEKYYGKLYEENKSMKHSEIDDEINEDEDVDFIDNSSLQNDFSKQISVSSIEVEEHKKNHDDNNNVESIPPFAQNDDSLVNDHDLHTADPKQKQSLDNNLKEKKIKQNTENSKFFKKKEKSIKNSSTSIKQHLDDNIQQDSHSKNNNKIDQEIEDLIKTIK